MVLRRIDVLSTAKLLGILYAVFGLIGGVVFAVVALLGLFAGNPDSPAQTAFGALFGAGALVFFPILYGVMGFIGGALGAWLYNVLAGVVGGIRLELVNDTPTR